MNRGSRRFLQEMRESGRSGVIIQDKSLILKAIRSIFSSLGTANSVTGL